MRRSVRHVILTLALFAGVAGAVACTPPPTIVTQPGKAAYAADQVILRLKELSDVVIADTGTKVGQIKPADAFRIIEWISGDSHATPPTIGVAQLVANTPGQGWKATAKLGWQTRIAPILQRYPKLSPYVPIVDALLEVF